MPDTMRFAVDPLPGGSAAVGEEVSFREDGGRLLALNEDGEPFCAVPGRFAALLVGDVRAGAVSAEVSSREDERPVVSVTFGDAPAPGDGGRADADGGGGQKVVVEVEQPVADAAAGGVQTEQTDDEPAKKNPSKGTIVIGAIGVCLLGGFVISAVILPNTSITSQTASVNELSIEVPGDWTVYEGTEYDFTQAYSDDSDDISISLYGPEEIDGEFAACRSDNEEYMESKYSDGYLLTEDSFQYGLAMVDRFEFQHYGGGSDSEDYWSGYRQYIYSGDGYYVIYMLCPADEYTEYADEMEKILDSMVLEDPSTPTGTSEEWDSGTADEEAEAEVAEDMSESETDIQTLSDGEISYEVLAGWTVEDTTDDDESYNAKIEAYSSDGSQLALLLTGYSLPDTGSLDAALPYIERSFELDSSTLEQSEYGDGAIVCRYDYSDDDFGTAGYAEFVFSGDTYSVIYTFCYEDDFPDSSEMFETILDSLTIENPSEPDFS